MTQSACNRSQTVVRIQPSYLDPAADLSMVHYPDRQGQPWYIRTYHHFKLTMKLTPCASMLWEWILLKAPAGQMVEVGLKDFQAITGEYRKRPYSTKQIRRAVKELETLELVEVKEETLKMSARHPGPVTNSKSRGGTNKSSDGTLMSSDGTLMSLTEPKMSQAMAETLTQHTSQTPSDLFRSYRSAADQEAAAKIINVNAVGFEGQIKVETYGVEATGFKGDIEVEAHGAAEATGFKGTIEAVAHGASATGFEGNIEVTAQDGKAIGFDGDIEVEAYGAKATGFKGEIEVKAAGAPAVGFEGNISVTSDRSLIEAIKKLLGISKISYTMQRDLAATSSDQVVATIACYKEDLANWKGQLHSPTGYFLAVLKQCRSGRKPVEQHQIMLAEAVDPVDEALEGFQRWWQGAPLNARPFLLRDIESAWAGHIAVLDPEEGPVRVG